MRYKDLVNQKFGRLTALYKLHNNHTKYAVWLCVCDCGNLKEVKSDALRTGNTKSCGCLNIDIHSRHKLSRSRIYYIWCHIKARCTNKNNKDYQNYGARGITICDSWTTDFLTFHDWTINNGYQDNLTIDRINVDGNYEPENCRWATLKEQCRNKRNNRNITINGETHCLKEWCEILNLNYNTARTRLYHLKWPIENVLKQEAHDD